jgi:hypothetical protein
MNYQAFTNESLTMMYNGVRGALGAGAFGFARNRCHSETTIVHRRPGPAKRMRLTVPSG